jgi:hypothetical protein
MSRLADQWVGIDVEVESSCFVHSLRFSFVFVFLGLFLCIYISQFFYISLYIHVLPTSS